MTSQPTDETSFSTSIAIIGMAGRFPGAQNVGQFWNNIAAGIRSIRFFSDEELLAAGVDPAQLRQPGYVKAGTTIDNYDHFDANFFGYPPREAEAMDPQHRLFLESAWEALEDAAYNPETYQGLIGVFAGTCSSTYAVHNIMTRPDIAELLGTLQVFLNNDIDSLASTVSYKLNLRGPSIAVQTFCSTSLVATHLACRSLLTYECDIALAGGVIITIPHGTGYQYQEGGILSPDGYCRAFDAKSQGSVIGNGVGVVALKRMEEALADGDHIYAVIRGSAVNNDGIRKVGYTAPGLAGQTAVIMEGLVSADVPPETVSYIETHGTGTPLGDSIELAAMIKAFQHSTQKKQFCAITSAKPNVGHLDRASGVTGLIKAVMALKHQQLPPSIDFESPNPEIDLPNSPFYVNTQLRDWPANDTPRRAGVNSFGLGGTNAHVVLEETPARPPSSPSHPYHLLLLSAKTENALEHATANIAAHCRAHPDTNPADLAYTLQIGRAVFNHRRTLVYRDLADLLGALDPLDPKRSATTQQIYRNRSVAFLLPGVGDHYVGMAHELYTHEPHFRATIDHCFTILSTHLSHDLRSVLYPAGAHDPASSTNATPDLRAMLRRTPGNESPLHATALAQPAVFIVEYALAQLLNQWGITPQALIGYSLGEYVAACLAGVLSLDDALRLVAKRAELIQTLPRGAMLAVSCDETEIAPYLNADISLAAINGPNTCVLAGPPDAIAAVAATLNARDIASRMLETTHAFHSTMLAPIADAVTELVRSVTLNPPQTPYLSNVSGTWITAEEATDPGYWARHMCQTVRFADGIHELLQQTQLVLIEVGPGQGLSSFVKQHPNCTRERLPLILATLPAAHERQSDLAALLATLGKLWMLDVPIDWRGFYADEQRYRIALPTYPFERQRYWIEPGKSPFAFATQAETTGKRADIADWFYLPVWEPAPLTSTPTNQAEPWLLFVDETGFGARLAQHLEQNGRSIIRIHRGAHFAQPAHNTFHIRSHIREDYTTLIRTLAARNQMPSAIAHLWNITGAEHVTHDPSGVRAAKTDGFDSLLCLAQALGDYDPDTPTRIIVATNGVQPVRDDDPLVAEHAPLMGICKVITQEYVMLTCRSLDLLTPVADSAQERHLLDLLVQELTTHPNDTTVAYRDGQRLVQHYRPQRLEAPASEHTTRLRHGGVYMITGGLGGVGLLLAEHLARTQQAKLVLVGRSGLPARETWNTWLAEHASDDSTSQRIQKIQTLETLGAHVLVLSADVADETSIRSAIAQTIAHFGALHGIIYAAGISDDRAFGLIQETNRANYELHFPSKIDGLYALEHALHDHPLDFCILFSSVSSVLGGLGFAGYVAANSFIDIFTHRHNRTHADRWTCVNWDTWHLREGQHDVIGATVAQYEMFPAEGAAAFERILESNATQIINSTGDLDARIRQWILLESLQDNATDTQDANFKGHSRPELDTAYAPPTGDYERRVAAIWQQVLGIEQVGIHDNFFDLGGNSLISLQLIAKLKKEFKVQIPAVALFEAPTVSALAQYLMPDQTTQHDQESIALTQRRDRTRRIAGTQDIAIISMVGRFPGADTVEQLWQNLCNGVEATAHFTDAELLESGIDPTLIQDPNYVKSRPILNDVALFDAAFFGYTPREAELLDPQQRLFHECAWEALETAGYDTQRYKGLVGVFGGTNVSSYLIRLSHDPAIAATMGDTTILENDKDALTTNVSYKLNLRGPSFAVQTFCSTSLVATHLACRSLLNGECDMALAGGVSVRVPVKSGYLYVEGDQVSPDGHCRTFDARAKGATFGDGVAIVVLKRLADALEDGDTIHAVIKGSAINNDGGLKVGYTAPSVIGQADVVLNALDSAGIDPTSIGYIEAHGTATPLGDPIEVASLTRAFRKHTDAVGFCAISSVKPNVGHLDRAAGVTGLIKTVMALKDRRIPATLHFESPNPEIDFENSPFYVTTHLMDWPAENRPRRAGVNSLGVGGTNAHVIVEEPPPLPPTTPSRPSQLLLLSARTADALDAATANLYNHLSTNPDLDLADIAYTLHVGRRIFEHRRMLICRDRDDALTLLSGGEPRRILTTAQKPTSRAVAFMFPGVGDHYINMARELYQHEPTFRHAVDRCCRILKTHIGRDLREIIYPDGTDTTSTDTTSGIDLRAMVRRGPATPTETPLHETAIAQPTVFVIAYALTQLLHQWGITPQAMIGYSLGEYVAACVAGVLSLDDALLLVAKRAELIQTQPRGAMLAVSCDEASIQPYLSETICLAAVNGPNTCVLSGPPEAIRSIEQTLTAREIVSRPIETTHAFHSTMLAPIADDVTTLAESIKLNPPRIPYLSNVSGTWITAEEATDPRYWARHMCQTVRFADGVRELFHQGEHLILEVGPGQGLSSFVKQHPACKREQIALILPTLRTVHERQSDLVFLLGTLGRLWLLDCPIDWNGFYAGERRRRLPLPTYPFERQRYWVEPNRNAFAAQGSAERKMAIDDWFATTSWKRSNPPLADHADARLAEQRTWLLCIDGCGVGMHLARWLTDHNQSVVIVTPGALFGKLDERTYTIRPSVRADYETLLRELQNQQFIPQEVVHLWSVTPAFPHSGESDDELTTILDHGFYSLLALAQALGDHGIEFCRVSIVSNDMQEVSGTETLCPAKATIIGPCKIISQEYPNIVSRSIDIALPAGPPAPALVQHLARELVVGIADDMVALRGAHRWVQTYESINIPPTQGNRRLRENGVYMITGGLGGIGLAMAEHLADTLHAKLALVGRSALPPRDQWTPILAAEGTEKGIGRRIHLIQTLEARGIEVLVIQADVADTAQMHAAVAQTIARFGALHGVIHTAGVPGIGIMQLKTAEAATGVLAPKVRGTLALARALAGHPLDFLVLFSSVTSATGGGPGQADYCAANAFLDAYARRHATDHGLTIAVSWGEWQWDAWSEGLQGFPEDVRARFIAYRRAYGISFPDGAEALTRVLAHDLPHIFVTTQDILFMAAGSKRSAAETFAEFREQQQARPRYPRPVLGTSYAAPTNELETKIAALWEETLGIDRIGIDDNFFELGGSSLLGIGLIAQLRKELKIDKLPAYVLYEAPTVSALAAYVSRTEENQEPPEMEHIETQTEKRQERLDFFKRRAQAEEVL